MAPLQMSRNLSGGLDMLICILFAIHAFFFRKDFVCVSIRVMTWLQARCCKSVDTSSADAVSECVLELKMRLYKKFLTIWPHIVMLRLVLNLFVSTATDLHDSAITKTLEGRRVSLVLNYLFIFTQQWLASKLPSPKRQLDATYVMVHLFSAAMFVQLIFTAGVPDAHFSYNLLFYSAFFVRILFVVLLATDVCKVIMCNLTLAVVISFLGHSVFADDPVKLKAIAAQEFFTLSALMILHYIARFCFEQIAQATIDTEHMKRAVHTLLRGLCDAVVNLDPELQIADTDSQLMNLLATGVGHGDSEQLCGTKFVQHLATEADQERFLKFASTLRQPVEANTVQSQPPAALHVHMQDLSGSHFPTQLFCACVPSIYDKPCFLVGICEIARLPREACAAAPPQDDVCLPKLQAPNMPEALPNMLNDLRQNHMPLVYFDCFSPGLEILEFNGAWTALCGKGEPCVSAWMEPHLFARFQVWLQTRVNNLFDGGKWTPDFAKEIFCKVESKRLLMTRNLTVTLLDPAEAFSEDPHEYMAILALEPVPNGRSKRSKSSRASSSKYSSSLHTVHEQQLTQSNDDDQAACCSHSEHSQEDREECENTERVSLRNRMRKDTMD